MELAPVMPVDLGPQGPQRDGNNRFITDSGVARAWNYHGKLIKIWTEPMLHETNINLNEESVHSRWWRDITMGDVVLDIGSAYGSYALPALALGASFVMCWAPENYDQILRKNLEINGWEQKSYIYSTGLWSEDGFVTPNHPHMPTFSKTKLDDSYFPVVRLDDVIDERERFGTIQKVDWMKIDTEGAEIEILKGAMRMINRHKPKILTENHAFKRITIADDTARFLATLGYVEKGRVEYNDFTSHSLFAHSQGI